MLGAGVEHLPAQLAIELPAAAYNAVAGFDWSPDLSAVVFGFNQALWILTPGGTPALLAEEGRYPRWSPVQPDGRTQIAFFSAQLGGPADQRIESIDPAGAGRRTVVSGGTGRNATSINPNGMLHWSPHGTYLLYQAYSADAKGVYGYVYRVAADGTGSKALTDKTPSPACPRGWVE
jgi:Tol biopolymer transport system component